MTCYGCKYLHKHAGTSHIGCGNPPQVWVDLDVKGGVSVDERKQSAEALVKTFQETSELTVAARLVWRDSGIFPLEYDGGTVVACSNHEEGPGIAVNQFKTIMDTIQTGRISLKVGTMIISKRG